jgi:hypothetical protein
VENGLEKNRTDDVLSLDQCRLTALRATFPEPKGCRLTALTLKAAVGRVGRFFFVRFSFIWLYLALAGFSKV